jgi:hypothetical protein
MSLVLHQELDKLLYGHFILGQRSRFISADISNRAKCFHRRKFSCITFANRLAPKASAMVTSAGNFGMAATASEMDVKIASPFSHPIIKSKYKLSG